MTSVATLSPHMNVQVHARTTLTIKPLRHTQRNPQMIRTNPPFRNQKFLNHRTNHRLMTTTNRSLSRNTNFRLRLHTSPCQIHRQSKHPSRIKNTLRRIPRNQHHTHNSNYVHPSIQTQSTYHRQSTQHIILHHTRPLRPPPSLSHTMNQHHNSNISSTHRRRIIISIIITSHNQVNKQLTVQNNRSLSLNRRRLTNTNLSILSTRRTNTRQYRPQHQTSHTRIPSIRTVTNLQVKIMTRRIKAQKRNQTQRQLIQNRRHRKHPITTKLIRPRQNGTPSLPRVSISVQHNSIRQNRSHIRTPISHIHHQLPNRNPSHIRQPRRHSTNPIKFRTHPLHTLTTNKHRHTRNIPIIRTNTRSARHNQPILTNPRIIIKLSHTITSSIMIMTIRLILLRRSRPSPNTSQTTLNRHNHSQLQTSLTTYTLRIMTGNNLSHNLNTNTRHITSSQRTRMTKSIIQLRPTRPNLDTTNATSLLTSRNLRTTPNQLRLQPQQQRRRRTTRR